MANAERSADPKLDRMTPALERIDRAIYALGQQGLQRATSATVRELRAVAQTAHHARLIRLERELESLATLVRRYLDRDPSFRPASFVACASRIWLLQRETRMRLVDAISLEDMEPVAGVPRRRYDAVRGALDVVCVGAAGWVTDSGFVGITAHLYDRAGKRFVQAAMVRPDSLVGRNPGRLLSSGISDVTPVTVQELCHGAWTLDNVRLSFDGRLSLHAHLSLVEGPNPGRAGLSPLAVPSAGAILDRLAERALHPVTGVGRRLVLIEPVRVGAVEIDRTHARATTRVSDGDGAVMGVSVPLRPENDVLIDNLERLSGAWAPDGLVVEATLAGRALVVSPLSAVYAEPVTLGRRISSTHLVHLSLEDLSKAKR